MTFQEYFEGFSARIEWAKEFTERQGIVSVPEGHPDQYALDVLSRILGGLSSSRIDETIVNKERIASGAGTSHPSLKHAGWFQASAAL